MKTPYSLYLIVDNTQLDTLADVIDHGVTCVQLRMKNKPLATILSTAEHLMRSLQPRNIPLIINDHVEIAKRIDAAGVHLGQRDESYAEARQQLGYKKIIGVSIQNSQQAKQYQSLDCDYFGVGPIFTTTTKQDASPAIGVNGLKEITGILHKPIVAIGGINESNVAAVLSAPIAGIALSAGIFSANCPQQSTQKLAQIISRGLFYASS